MASAQEWSGISQGFSQLSQNMSTADLRAAQLSEAKAKQQKAQRELAEYNNNAPTRERTGELQLQQLEATTRKMNQQSLSSITINAMDRYNADGNPRHLNTWLKDAKKNPVGNNIYGEVARYDALTKSESNDKLLRQAGYNPDDVYSDPESASDMIVVTQNNGNQVLLPKEKMFAATKYTDYLDDKAMKKLESKARISQMLRQGQSRKTVDMKERVVQDLLDSGKAETLAEAYQMQYYSRFGIR
jgi:PHD/YefM family antitoxin component YafN of YafNO toxin-antitoxin module